MKVVRERLTALAATQAALVELYDFVRDYLDTEIHEIESYLTDPVAQQAAIRAYARFGKYKRGGKEGGDRE